MNRIFKILSIFIVIIVIFTACAHSSQNRNLDTYSSNTGNRHNDNKYADEETENVVAELPTVGSYEKLVELLEEIEGQSGIMFGGILRDSVVISDADFSTAAQAPRESAAAEKPSANTITESSSQKASSEAKSDEASYSGIEADGDYSGTNVQVQGVDEADVVKTDGEYIYQVNRQRIVIVKAYPSEKMKVESITSFNEMNFNPVEMYIHGDKLVVIGNSYVNYIVPQKHIEEKDTRKSNGLTEKDPVNQVQGKDTIQVQFKEEIQVEQVQPKIYPPPYYHSETVKAVIYDISDKTNPKKLREVDLEGYYISSRKIGPHLYIIANKYIDYYRIMDKSAAEYQDYKAEPAYRDTAVKDDFIDVDFKSIRYFPECVEPNYMIIAGIDIDNIDKQADISTYLGSGQNIYASLENLYVTITGYRQIDIKPDVETSTDGGENSSDSSSGVSSDTEPAVETPAVDAKIAVIRGPQVINEENTMIYKFALGKGNVIYRSKGEVPGRILNQFSMDENGKFFRIATTTGQIWRDDEFTSKNNIYILNDVLDIKGKIEDIAPGEQIYSVRFMGDRAYMVTFRTVDPLFVIDLKDPEKPKILGALKIPGYSDYLHPYDENHIIGFGKDTVELKGQAYYLGMKIALFDVTDVSNPIQKFTENIGDRGTESEILRNHKALLFSKEKGLMAFPVTVMEVKGKNKFMDNGFPEYGQFSFQGAYVYNIDLVNGFTLKGRITHLSKDDYLRSGTGWYDSDKNISRLLYIKDNLYTLSNSIIKANELENLEDRNQVNIP
jgi:inhibitor of cysteine peptidase